MVAAGAPPNGAAKAPRVELRLGLGGAIRTIRVDVSGRVALVEVHQMSGCHARWRRSPRTAGLVCAWHPHSCGSCSRRSSCRASWSNVHPCLCRYACVTKDASLAMAVGPQLFLNVVAPV